MGKIEVLFKMSDDFPFFVVKSIQQPASQFWLEGLSEVIWEVIGILK